MFINVIYLEKCKHTIYTQDKHTIKLLHLHVEVYCINDMLKICLGRGSIPGKIRGRTDIN